MSMTTEKPAMAAPSSSSRILPWVATLLLSFAAAFGAIEATRMYLEHSYKALMEIEVGRRAFEITSQTMQGNVMGSVANLGLVNQAMKSVAQGKAALDDPVVMNTLQAVGDMYQANGVYVVNSNGVIQSCWYTMGKTLTGVDIKFRPYFQIAMQGKKNVYAAIGTTTGKRSLYFAAPLYGEVSSTSPIIGATVARLDIERVDSVLKAWPDGAALLLSPQKIAFASSRADWVEQMAGAATPEQLKAIRELKQFGNTFEKGTPKILPFDIRREIVRFDKRRYAVSLAPVQWNDPHGEWTLVLLGDLDKLMPGAQKAKIGAASGVLTLLLSALLLFWRRRLNHAESERQKAEAELQVYTRKLESDSAIKSDLTELADDLHQTASLADFARKFMHHVTPRLDADYGAFYVLDEESQRLIPVGGHGILANNMETIGIGQGLVGQCAKEMAPIVVADPAETAIRITWGEGSAAPRSVIFLPVTHSSVLLGVIVLASLRAMDGEKQALLDTILPIVAINLEILNRNLATKHQADILSQQQAHTKETEAWFRGIIESAPDGMLVGDERGVIILSNPAIEAMFGYASGELVGKSIEALVPAAARGHHARLRDGFLQAGRSRPMGSEASQLQGVRADGSEFPVEVGLSMLPALGGRGVCVCASVRDISKRKEAERTIAESRATMIALMNSIPDLIFYKDQAGVYLGCNNAFGELIGRPVPEIIGKADYDLFPREVADFFRDKDAEMFSALERRSNEEWVNYPDGRRVMLDTLKSPFWDGEGRLLGILGISRDITERKQAEDAIDMERERLKRILDTSPLIVAITVNGQVQYANQLASETFGIKVGDKSPQLYVHPEERDALIERLKRDGFVKNHELQMFDKRKVAHDMLVTYMPINYNGEDGILGWLMDITERKQAEEAIAMERERLQQILSTSPMSVAFAVKGKLRFVNSRFIETFGLREGDDTERLYVNPEDWDKVDEILKRDGIVENLELLMFDDLHRTRSVLATYLPILYNDDEGVISWLMAV
jgi:PAS domain S-box-containing protein